ncbi:MAG: hypothetical protein Q9217_003427 [Psora testacea]
MDKTLPVDATATTKTKQPWLLYALPVNALNFCPFAMCYDGMPQTVSSSTKALKDPNAPNPILIAVPNAIDNGGIDVFQLPSQKRVAMITSDRFLTTGQGFVFYFCARSSQLTMHRHADANIAKHPLPSDKSIFKTEYKPIKVSATKHSGQQGLSYRSDGKIFATAGWDSALRIYSGKTLKEVAVLKWHKEGCYTTAFAAVETSRNSGTQNDLSANANGQDYGLSMNVATRTSSINSIQEKRDETVRTTHWFAAGSKDGKVSLWDIY